MTLLGHPNLATQQKSVAPNVIMHFRMEDLPGVHPQEGPKRPNALLALQIPGVYHR